MTELSRSSQLVGTRYGVALVIVTLLICGLWLRAAIWSIPLSKRAPGDLANALYCGKLLNRMAAESGPVTEHPLPAKPVPFIHAYRAFYDEVVRTGWQRPGHTIDYVPFRLLIMAIWARSIDENPDSTDLSSLGRASRPLFWVNVTFDVSSTVLAFVLVRTFWEWRDGAANRLSATTLHQLWARRPSRNAAVAAVLFWLNPSTIADAYGWPQWDIWIVPFLLGAILFAISHRWRACGAMLGLGMMFKGQVLFVAPVFLFWPVFAREWAYVGRVLGGFAAAVVSATAIWLLPTTAAFTFASALFAITCAWGLSISRFGHPATIGATAATAVVALWVALAPAVVSPARGASFLLLAFSVIAALGLRSGRRSFVLGAFATSIITSAVLFHGSSAWLQVGIYYGAHNQGHMGLAWPVGLATMAERYLGWVQRTPVPVGPFRIQSRFLLDGLFCALTVGCGWAAARQSRARSRYLLVVLVAPWLIFFCVLPQMTTRYLFWAAALSSTWAGVSRTAIFVHLVITTVSALQVQKSQRGAWPFKAFRYFSDGRRLHPNPG